MRNDSGSGTEGPIGLTGVPFGPMITLGVSTALNGDGGFVARPPFGCATKTCDGEAGAAAGSLGSAAGSVGSVCVSSAGSFSGRHDSGIGFGISSVAVPTVHSPV